MPPARKEQAGAPALAGRADLLAGLADLVTPAAREPASDLPLRSAPDNVLVDGTGDLVLLDWDDAGPACPDRELAGSWCSGMSMTAARPMTPRSRATLAAYQAAGGPAAFATSGRSACTSRAGNFLTARPAWPGPSAAPSYRELRPPAREVRTPRPASTVRLISH